MNEFVRFTWPTWAAVLEPPTRGVGRFAHVALALLLTAASAAGAQPTGAVEGTVQDARGAAVSEATATLLGMVARSTETDAQGRFAFAGLPSGSYVLTVERPGAATEERALELVSGQTATVAFVLQLAVSETVTVTADRTGDRDIQSTPLALSVLSGEELQRTNAGDIPDLAGRAPSVTFSQNAGYGQLTIRGIGTNLVFAGSDPSSAVYLDGVYLARPAMILSTVLDLDRVEVLRGPQGALYGRNAVGGAVSLLTKAPTDRFSASVRLGSGTLATRDVEGRVSGPLSRRVTGSVSLARRLQDGFVQDLAHDGRRLGGDDFWATRGKLRIRVAGRTELLLSTDAARQTAAPLNFDKILAVKSGFAADNPSDPRQVRLSLPASARNLEYGTSAQWRVHLPRRVELSAITAYRGVDHDTFVDADATDLPIVDVRLHERQHQISQEVTASRRGARITWLGGAMFFHERERQPTSIRFNLNGIENRPQPDVDSTAEALYAQTTIALSSRVGLVTGLRYSDERKTMDNAGGNYPFASPDIAIPGSSYSYRDHLQDSAWTPKAALEFHPSETTTFYSSAARGFKSGGFNSSSPVVTGGYAPEWAWSYETGAKTTSANGRTRLSASAFVVDYTNLQVQIILRPGVLDISNAARASIKGLELEGTSRVAGGFEVGGFLAWLDARYKQYIAAGLDDAPADAGGHALNNAPRWSGRAWLDWTKQASAFGRIATHVEVRSQGRVFFEPVNNPLLSQAAFGVVDVSTGLQLHRCGCELSAYVRNLTNTNYITGATATPPMVIGGRPGEPRVVGIRLTFSRGA